ncbi:MAG: peptide chain release factor N(5)-glutamine methyltransferase [Ruminococcaceae bacterium]|nr:peptide chain release factor N(5)-glutamine methyltransferase [Oscillospiraceae bacterium]
MVRDLLKDAAQKLSGCESPMLDARVLLAAAMGKKDAALIFDMPDNAQLSLFNKYIEKRAEGIPVAYILGEKEFMGLTFHLNSDTLIPRPDTECLVEKVIEKNGFSAPKILDLCTGSGCIGISLVHFIKNASCDLTDISEGAMKMAKENAYSNGVSDRCKVFRLDILFDKILKGYDIIVSNPPYIESDVVKTLEVSRYEPERALDGGFDGLDFYRIIAKKAYNALEKGGILALEIGYNQGESVKALLKDFSDVQVYKDYGNNDRVIIGIK